VSHIWLAFKVHPVFYISLSASVLQVEPGKDGAGLPKSDASKVRVHGDGINPTGVKASNPVSFVVDTSDAGDANVDVIIKVKQFVTK